MRIKRPDAEGALVASQAVLILPQLAVFQAEPPAILLFRELLFMLSKALF